jgi:cytochrome c553
VEGEVIRYLSLIGAVLMASPVSAGHCVQRQVVVKQNYGYYGKQVYLQQIQAPYYYSVGAVVREEAIAEKIARRVEAKLTQRLKVLEQPKLEHPGVAMLTSKCATCHSPGTKAVVEKKAPEFFAADGALKELNEKQRNAIDSAVNEGRMPPTGEPLADGEYITIRDYLFPQGGK